MKNRKTKVVARINLLKITTNNCFKDRKVNKLAMQKRQAALNHLNIKISYFIRCKIGNLGGKVQWSTDGFAMGYKLETIKSYCSKCAPRGNTNKGEFHLYVEDVELGRYNEFECQVSPDHSNAHQALRARAILNVIGKILFEI